MSDLTDHTNGREQETAPQRLAMIVAYKELRNHPRIRRIAARLRNSGYRVEMYDAGQENAVTNMGDEVTIHTIRRAYSGARFVRLATLPTRGLIRLLRLLRSWL